MQTWDIVRQEFGKPYMIKLFKYLKQRKKQGKIIFPSTPNILNALKLTPLQKVKVVILGQDPYCGINQANGLCFSVNKYCKIPASLFNIYKEIKNDLNINYPNHGCLDEWAKQGVLLLNTILTVEKNFPLSHKNIGWEKFTDKIINIINKQNKAIIFVLWGKIAQKKNNIIDKKHTILQASHPSPLSAQHGFFGCKHFSKINKILVNNNQSTINWKLFNI